MRVAVVVLVFLFVAGPLSADTIAIGQTARLTQGDLQYTGVIVKPNELAPCNAKSQADDIVFDPKKDKVVLWPKPCPKLPRYLPADAVNRYLSGHVDLTTATAVSH